MDNVEKSSFQMMNIIGKKVKCSRCNNEATNITNDVPYCALCYIKYYYPNLENIENYQDSHIIINLIKEIKEMNIKDDATFILVEDKLNNILMRANRIHERLDQHIKEINKK